MARPRKEEKTEFVGMNFKLTIPKYILFEECYKKSECKTKTQFLISMLNSYDDIKKLEDLKDGLFDEILKHRNLLLNATNNINQIAKQINTMGYSASENDIISSLEEIKNVLPELKKRSDELLKKSYTMMKKL
ncbi:MAG: MobC family plasmid mobilization relaxosome protein [Lachnospiraceae bacterium]|nr:MobC family plasmid mobilization relaxosome protein [Lachnospiraceae bacterium]